MRGAGACPRLEVIGSRSLREGRGDEGDLKDEEEDDEEEGNNDEEDDEEEDNDDEE